LIAGLLTLTVTCTYFHGCPPLPVEEVKSITRELHPDKVLGRCRETLGMIEDEGAIDG